MNYITEKLMVYSPLISLVLCLVLYFMFTKSKHIKFWPNLFGFMLMLFFLSIVSTVLVIGVFAFIQSISEKAQGSLVAVFIGPAIGQIVGYFVWRKMNA